VLETDCATVPPALCTAGGGETGCAQLLQTLGAAFWEAMEPGEFATGVPPLEGPPAGCAPRPSPATWPGCATRPGAAPLAAVPATAVAAPRAVAAVSSRPAREGAEPTLALLTDTDTGAGCPPTCGHPWNATIALASTNIAAAPASKDPEVPNPAKYPRVARTFVPYRTAWRKPLPLSG